MNCTLSLSSPKSRFNDHLKSFREAKPGGIVVSVYYICLRLNLISGYRLYSWTFHSSDVVKTWIWSLQTYGAPDTDMHEWLFLHQDKKKPQPPTPTWQCMVATSCQLIREEGLGTKVSPFDPGSRHKTTFSGSWWREKKGGRRLMRMLIGNYRRRKWSSMMWWCCWRGMISPLLYCNPIFRSCYWTRN